MKAAHRQKGALVWLAILTIAAVGVVRAESGWSNQTPYTQSMLRFLAAHPEGETLAAGMPALLEHWSGGTLSHSARRSTLGAQSGVFLFMLPVVFVGLATPFSLSSAIGLRTDHRIPASAPFFSCYKRPPPSLRA
ncbi:MAG: hypothetical protein KGN79_15725 [Acidobacteriota bacterium]|nr:hypothetical protein [Acidobacteriota bacterium]